MESVSLRYTEGSSDKIYQAEIVQSGDGYAVNFAFGRYGSSPQAGTKTAKPVPYAKAKAVFDKLISEKLGKGYRALGSSTVQFVGLVDGKQQTGVKPQLLNPIEEDELEPFFASPEWLMQEKKDGERRLVRKGPAGIVGINRKGEIVPLRKEIAFAVSKMAGSFLIDGEEVGDVYYAFDILEADGADLRELTYFSRATALFDKYLAAFGGAGNPNCLTVLTYGSEAGKRKAFAKVKAERGEGVVFKDRNALYTAGRPNSGGAQRKFKFTQTATCQVLGQNGEKRSVFLSVRNGTEDVAVGKVTVPPNYGIPTAGAIVEIRYLAAYPGGALYQPVYLGERSDKDLPDEVATLKFKQGTTDEDDAN